MIERAKEQIVQLNKLVQGMKSSLKSLESQMNEEQKKLYSEMQSDLLKEMKKGGNTVFNTEKITKKWVQKVSNLEK